MSKRYNVCTPRPKKDGGTWWCRIGTAFEGEKSINVVFEALPLADKEGRVSVSLFEQRDERERPDDIQPPMGNGPRQPNGSRAQLDDDIPFAPEFR